jgi:hypothetical protein
MLCELVQINIWYTYQYGDAPALGQSSSSPSLSLAESPPLALRHQKDSPLAVPSVQLQ